MRSYFLHIAAVKKAAEQEGIKLYDNYAYLGALGRFADADVGEITEADGITDVPQKAESFVFGQKCGKNLREKLAGLNEDELFRLEASAAREMFLKDDELKKYPSEKTADIKGTFVKIINALFKRAQLQTHTAKPGYENINAWLDAYRGLLEDYEPYINKLAEEIFS